MQTCVRHSHARFGTITRLDPTIYAYRYNFRQTPGPPNTSVFPLSKLGRRAADRAPLVDLSGLGRLAVRQLDLVHAAEVAGATPPVGVLLTAQRGRKGEEEGGSGSQTAGLNLFLTQVPLANKSYCPWQPSRYRPQRPRKPHRHAPPLAGQPASMRQCRAALAVDRDARVRAHVHPVVEVPAAAASTFRTSTETADAVLIIGPPVRFPANGAKAWRG